MSVQKEKINNRDVELPDAEDGPLKTIQTRLNRKSMMFMQQQIQQQQPPTIQPNSKQPQNSTTTTQQTTTNNNNNNNLNLNAIDKENVALLAKYRDLGISIRNTKEILQEAQRANDNDQRIFCTSKIKSLENERKRTEEQIKQKQLELPKDDEEEDSSKLVMSSSGKATIIGTNNANNNGSLFSNNSTNTNTNTMANISPAPFQLKKSDSNGSLTSSISSSQQPTPSKTTSVGNLRSASEKAAPPIDIDFTKIDFGTMNDSSFFSTVVQVAKQIVVQTTQLRDVEMTSLSSQRETTVLPNSALDDPSLLQTQEPISAKTSTAILEGMDYDLKFLMF